jgi:uncharacterized membrane protein
MEPVARLLELAGVAAILIAVVYATGRFLLDLRRGESKAYSAYRANLGRGILLGLEFLVGADIIATVTAPLTWESVGLLAVIVAIRTMLSFALETEIEGRWPWQRGAERNHERDD